MGRVTPTHIQRVGLELIQKHPKKFNTNFDDNKKQIDELAEVPTKKLRNRLAGYVTRSVKNKKEIKLE